MKIWIDITNAPHVNFFRQFIEEWQRGHDVIITARPLSNTIDLLNKNKIEYHCVGSHYGKKNLSKVIGFYKRCNELYSFLKEKEVAVAISQSSFYSPYVARKLRVPCIYTNDNEFAKGNYIAFFYAKHILLPEALKTWTQKRIFEKKVTYYPGVKEGIYIKQPERQQDKNGMPMIYFRPEPWHSQYHTYHIDLFDKMLTTLSNSFSIMVLSRDEEQKAHFIKLSKQYQNLHIPEKVETIDTIAQKCDIFLGAGGSMTREFALMGTPTISMYQGELLKVDKYLIDNNLLISQTDPQKITPEFVNTVLQEEDVLKKTHEELQKKGQEARTLINNIINDESLRN